jgi:hypothetical protein
LESKRSSFVANACLCNVHRREERPQGGIYATSLLGTPPVWAAE